MNIILASASPRRTELMSLITKDFTVKVSNFDESTMPDFPDPVAFVKYSSLMKAQDVFVDNPQCIVIGADTVVAVDDEILGKPRDDEDAFDMLRKLSGRAHKVVTGVTVISRTCRICTACETEVLFDDMTDESIRKYVATGEPSDKAGAYAVQGLGAKYIKGVKGDFFNVVGLPVHLVANILAEFGEDVL